MDPQERKRQILDCAAEVFASKGVSATSVREVADSVGVYSGTLYHYFPSKDKIVAAIIREYLQDLSTRSNAVVAKGLPPVARLEALVLTALTCCESHPNATSIWQSEGAYMREKMLEADLGDLAADVETAWVDAITAGVAEGSLRSDIDITVFYRLIRDAVWLAMQWHRPSDDYPTDRLARDTVTIFVDGFRAPD